MNICIIGNSHVAALKGAWKGIQNTTGLNFTFFASRGNSLQSLEYKDGTLYTESQRIQSFLEHTSEGKSEITLCDYDLFLLYGIGAVPYIPSDGFYSSAALNSAIEDYYSDRVFFRIMNLIRKGSNSRIFIGHKPLVANPDVDQTTSTDLSYNQYSRNITTVNTSYFKHYNSTFIHQPQETLTSNSRNTKLELCRGSKRLAINENTIDDKHNTSDYGHMNEIYGKIYMNNLVDMIATHQTTIKTDEEVI